MKNEDQFRVLLVNLTEGRSGRALFGDRAELLGGSGLAAALFEAYGLPDAPADHPDQPMIFAIGPLTGYYPLMSKVVLGFKSPYHQQYAESHAGGRLGLALRFTGYDAIVIRGAAKTASCLIVGQRKIELLDVQYLWGQDVLATGRLLRRIYKTDLGHRSILRIGPAGENQAAYAGVNVDTYRHFGRLGAGSVMGAKKLKAMIVIGDASIDLPEAKEYGKLYKQIFDEAVGSPAMKKYHDLGTPENLTPLNELKALPWRNLQATKDEGIQGISGERFADALLLRKTACAGCPVGCIHVGLLREPFGAQHEFFYRQVSYDFEPVFAVGSMLGITDAGNVLMLIEETERQGLDVISAGVALAWATEAMERGLITDKHTLVSLRFGHAEGFRDAIRHLGNRTNDFYRILGQGAGAAGSAYGGNDFACVLGQEMAGYATGEASFAAQAFGFRHSHLDSAGYSFDQKENSKDVEKCVAYLIEEERRRVGLTSMVSCLFARNLYPEERLQEALRAVGRSDAADSLVSRSKAIQAKRWQIRFRTGFDPAAIRIPARFKEISNWKGPIDEVFLAGLCKGYAAAIRDLAHEPGSPPA
jgi:aldehyde:ferredoxin oxidoreductase